MCFTTAVSTPVRIFCVINVSYLPDNDLLHTIVFHQILGHRCSSRLYNVPEILFDAMLRSGEEIAFSQQITELYHL